jgi:hypothetical protein
MIPIPILDSLIDAGKTVIDKIWMDKGDKAKIEITKEEMRNQFAIAMKAMNDNHELAKVEQVFKEHQAQRDFANDQFGKAEVLKEMGWTGRIIMFGRASIRWVITGGSMWFTWNIMNLVLTPDVIAALAAGTMSASGAWLITLLVCLIVGIPVFYVSGISIEKIIGVRNKI